MGQEVRRRKGSNMAKSFMIVLRRRYRVYFNTQTGYWFCAYREDGVRRRVSLGVKTKPEAEVAVRAMDEPPSEVKKVTRHSWQEFMMLFLDYKTMQGKAPRTIARYRACMKAVDRYFNSQKVAHLGEITLAVLEGYPRYRTQVEGRDESTAHNDSIYLKDALRWGAKASRGYLPTNPALGWDTPKPVKPKRRAYKAQEVASMEAGVREWLR